MALSESNLDGPMPIEMRQRGEMVSFRMWNKRQGKKIDKSLISIILSSFYDGLFPNLGDCSIGG